MLTKTPAGEHERSPAVTPTRFFDDISAALAEFAKIPPQKTEQFLTAIDLDLIAWVMEGDTGPRRGARDLRGLLADTRNMAVAMQQRLKKVQGRLKEQKRTATRSGRDWWRWGRSPFSRWKRLLFSGYIKRLGIVRHVQPDLVARAISTLSELTAALDKISQPRRGRPPGTKVYPGLDALIFGLEQAARENGGGFTLDKRCRKGTMIQALDWLRAYCIARPEWEWMGECLPPPGRHPIAMYVSAMDKARSNSFLKL